VGAGEQHDDDDQVVDHVRDDSRAEAAPAVRCDSKHDADGDPREDDAEVVLPEHRAGVVEPGQGGLDDDRVGSHAHDSIPAALALAARNAVATKIARGIDTDMTDHRLGSAIHVRFARRRGYGVRTAGGRCSGGDPEDGAL
jgi:hypothetical protein